MAAVWRLTRTLRSCRTIASAKTLNPRLSLSPSPRLPLSPPLYNRSFEQYKRYGSEGPRPKGVPEFFVHTALAGLLGFGLLDVAFADGDEVLGVEDLFKGSDALSCWRIAIRHK